MPITDRLNLTNKEVVKTLRKNSSKKFIASFSNPPYNVDTGNGSVAIYHHIMNVAKGVSNNISMIYPARWTSTGRGDGIDAFRDTELNSQHYKTFIIESGESTVFHDANIKGGVNYFHWIHKPGKITEYFYNGHREERTSLLNNKPMMISDPRFSKIVEKVKPNNHITVMSRNHYGMHLEADYNIEKLIVEDVEKQNTNDSTRIYYSGKGGGVRSIFIPKGSGKHPDSGYKAIVSRTADPDKKADSLRRQNRLFIIKPGEIVGGSFLQAGTYETEQEALNAVRYLRTVFASFLLGTITPTQNTTRKNYYLIPDLNFETGEILDKPGTFVNFNNFDETDSTISGTGSETLDEQLFKAYGIDEDEQKLMKDSVKPWKTDIPMRAEELI